MASSDSRPLLVNFTPEERGILRRLRDVVRLALGNNRASETSVAKAVVNLAADDPRMVKRIVSAHRRAQSKE